MRWQRLVEAFGITEAEARELARMMRKAADSGDIRPSEYAYEAGPLTTDDVLERANEILRGGGVEPIDCEYCQVDNYYFGIVLLYVNMGDTYTTTLLYDTANQKFLIGSWGDWYERHEAEEHPGEEETDDAGGEYHSIKNWRP